MKSLVKKLFIATFIFTVAFVGLGIKPAHALTVTPIRFELTGDKGQVITQKVTLINETQTAQTYYPSFANFEAQGEDGTPTFVDPKDGLGTWMSIPETSVAINPGQSVVIPLTIKIPSDAIPGGYFASLFFGTIPPSSIDTGVAIGAKTGILVLLSVNGEVQKSASIIGFDANQHFYTALPVEMTYRFQNTGGDRVKPDGMVTIKNILGIKATSLAANSIGGNVLPKQIRKFSVAWEKDHAFNADETIPSRSFFENVSYEWHNFALGYFTANLDLINLNGASTTASAQTKFIVFPWQLLAVVVFGGLILLFILRKIIKGYNRWIIGQAKAALRDQDKER